MKRYDSYKDSGVQWIGEIPSHWEVTPLKHVIKFINGFAFNSNDFDSDGDMPVYRIGDIVNDQVSTDSCIYVAKQDSLKSFEVKEGDILLAMSGATTGKIGLVSNQNGYINQRVGIIRSPIQKWVYFTLKTSFFTEYVYLSAIGSAQPNISTESFGNYLIVLPQKEEQTAIANYLDNKCSKIDNVIATQEKRVELLRELKQSIITRAVTRGINPDAKMKDSGVEWIGEIPEHWEVMKLNNICHTITDFVASGSFADLRNNVQYLDEPDYAMLVRTADLSQKNRDVAKVYVSKDSYDFLRNSNLYGGEIVLPNIGASIGDAYVVPKDIYEKMTLGPNSILLRTNFDDMFFYYYFCSKSGRESLILMGQAAAQSKFNKTELRQMKVIVPPIEEQRAIVTYIEQQTSRLDSSIAKALRQIELLKEYKQSLITEVVTGKRKVI